MKKLFISSILIVVFISSFSFFTFAANNDTDEITHGVKDELFSILDADIKDVLDDMGINEDSFDSIFEVSLSNITDFFKQTLTEKVKNCFGDISMLFVAVFLIGLLSAVFKDDKYADYFSLFSVVIVSLLTVSCIQNSLNAVLSVIKHSGNFMLSYIPIYTLIISFSGSPAGAYVYNSITLLFAESISSLLSYFFLDAMGIYFCFSISFMLNDSININRFISVMNKAVSLILGLVASVFTGFLSIKSVLGTCVDAVSVKSIRFLISSMIPVIGSSISEAYSSLLGSINLIKGSVAIVGIIVVLVINLPIIIETFVYYTAFSFLGFACEGLGNTRCSDVLRCFSLGVKIMLLVCVFQMFILVISTGIMLSFKGGG